MGTHSAEKLHYTTLQTDLRLTIMYLLRNYIQDRASDTAKNKNNMEFVSFSQRQDC